MNTSNWNQLLGERRSYALWMITWLLLTGALLFIANWEANRLERLRMVSFREKLADLAKISESQIAEQIRQIDDSMLVLRKAYVADPKRFVENIRLLRSGPLADHTLLVVRVDRDGYLAYTDAPDVKPRLYLGDRKYFRYFADGGKDQLYVDEPAFGRVTKRHTLLLARPIYDRQGSFLGVVTISGLQQSLGKLSPSSQLSGDITITIVNPDGSIISRSRDFSGVQGTDLPTELLAELHKGSEGVFSAVYEGIDHIIAYRQIKDENTPLIVYVDASPSNVQQDLSFQRAMLMWSAGFVSFIIILLIVFYLKGRKLSVKLIETLRKSKDQEYQALTRTPLDGFFIADKSGRILDANDTLCEMLGYTQNKLLSLSIPDIEAAESQEQVAEHIRKVITLGRDRFQTRLRCMDGKIIDVEMSVQHLKQKSEQFFVFARDITERKRAEEEILLYAATLETVAEGIFLIGVDDNIIKWTNAKFEKMFGYGPGEMVGMHVDKVNAPTEKTPTETRISIVDVLLQNKEWHGEIKNIKKDGTHFWCYVHVSLFDHPKFGRVMVSAHTDITDRSLAEKALRESENKFKSFSEHSLVGIYLIQDDIFTYVNPKFAEIFGYTVEECINKMHFGELVYPEDFDLVREQIRKRVSLETESAHYTYRGIKKTGELILVEIFGSFIIFDGRPTVTGTLLDITDRMRAEEEKMKLETQLRQSQKMEAIGTLAGGIAHDFNNILGGIMGYVELSLKHHIKPDNPATGYLKEVLHASIRAKDLVSQIVTFSRQTEQKRRPLNICPVIKESLKLLRASLPSNIEIHQHIDDMESNILAEPTQIQQVILNLCTNAYHAMGEKGGIIEISLNRVVFGSDDATVNPDIAQGVEYHELTIRDTGHGIDPSIIDRIFDPFFTTKKTGEGTGLGLAVVYGIVRSYDGAITVDSIPDKGTTFKIYFPAIKRFEEDDAEPEIVLCGGTEKIIFVDDEKFFTHIFRIQLENLGYSIRGYNNPEEALEDFKRNKAYYDLVITDKSMPHMNGVELANALIEIRPDIPVILCTGGIETIEQAVLDKAGIRKVIRKPITIGVMAEAIRQVLDAR